MRKRKTLSFGFYVLLTAVLAVGLLASGAMAKDLPGKGVKVQPVDQGLIEEQFQYEVLIAGLEELGYKVKPILHMAGEVVTSHLAVSRGDADFYAVHWDPLHTVFYEKAGGEEKMQRIGNLTPGALQGYLIDKKTATEHNITKMEQLKDPKIAAIFDADEMVNGDSITMSRLAWARISQWLPWMEMGSRPGLLIVNATGYSTFDLEDLPDSLISALKERYPLYLTAPPLDDARPNETSWTVFKKHLESTSGE